jgi:hypothetical protein
MMFDQPNRNSGFLVTAESYRQAPTITILA